jgi:hypothetical protein
MERPLGIGDISKKGDGPIFSLMRKNRTVPFFVFTLTPYGWI